MLWPLSFNRGCNPRATRFEPVWDFTAHNGWRESKRLEGWCGSLSRLPPFHFHVVRGSNSSRLTQWRGSLSFVQRPSRIIVVAARSCSLAFNFGVTRREFAPLSVSFRKSSIDFTCPLFFFSFFLTSAEINRCLVNFKSLWRVWSNTTRGMIQLQSTVIIVLLGTDSF